MHNNNAALSAAYADRSRGAVPAFAAQILFLHSQCRVSNDVVLSWTPDPQMDPWMSIYFFAIRWTVCCARGIVVLCVNRTYLLTCGEEVRCVSILDEYWVDIVFYAVLACLCVCVCRHHKDTDDADRARGCLGSVSKSVRPPKKYHQTFCLQVC